jgi:hypothetical protein
MRDLNTLNGYRLDVRAYYGWAGDGTCGAFQLPSPSDGQPLRIIASSDFGWDHVSVSRSNRCPNWPEMEFVKRRFFNDDECAMQLHVPVTDHLNLHAYTLHLWRPKDVDIPRPPADMVAPPGKPSS